MSIVFRGSGGEEIRFEKANPYHAADGKFTTKGGGKAAGSQTGSSGNRGANGGPVPEGKDPYEFRSKNVDKKNRAKFDAVDEVVSEGMSTGSRKADRFITSSFNNFCRTGEDKYLNDAAGKLYEFTGDTRLR